jgi:hypothetical protein
VSPRKPKEYPFLTRIYRYLLIVVSCSAVAAIAEPSHPTKVYWGDTHVHTYLSADAFGMGTRVTPDSAYRYARGDVVTADNGQKVQIRRPLDFLMVSDHAENLGMHQAIITGQKIGSTPAGKAWMKTITPDQVSLRDVVEATSDAEQQRLVAALGGLKGDWKARYIDDDDFRRSVWQDVIANAEKYNDPGRFTAFIGFEWTANPMIHRNVMFADGAQRALEVMPLSFNDTGDPEGLWRYLAGYERETGGRIMAIPHNANLSGGMMFTLKDHVGGLFSREYATTRARWEPIYEATQYKGDSETHPALSPDDEFADFEKLGMTARRAPVPKQKSDSKTSAKKRSEPVGKKATKEATKMATKKATKKAPSGKQPGKKPTPTSPATLSGNPLEGAYARSALKMGLDQQARLGINPFKLGLIGSTDSHIGLSSVDEDDYLGKQGAYRINSAMWNAGGYAAVWAKENTRQSIFEALRRREVYATTGPRMTVRVFGGWDFTSAEVTRADIVAMGYDRGVPMGGDLAHGPEGASPTFLIRAVRDPQGANLDRAQVIKGWRDPAGAVHERIYNVALSDGRTVAADGSVDRVGNTVNLEDASYTNSIGEAELTTVWVDPDFDPKALAFYYVRVLEIPTPRWTDYDTARLGTTHPPSIPVTTQERVYTSPIWYTPPATMSKSE